MGSEDSNRPQSWDPLRQGLVWPGPCLLTGLPRTAHHLGVCSHWMLGLPGLPKWGKWGQVISGSEDIPNPSAVASGGSPGQITTA